MENIIFKAIFKKGKKGNKGDSGISYDLPTNAVIGFDGAETPEGFIETTEPPASGNTIEIVVNGNGIYKASDYGVDAFSKVTVSII